MQTAEPRADRDSRATAAVKNREMRCENQLVNTSLQRVHHEISLFRPPHPRSASHTHSHRLTNVRIGRFSNHRRRGSAYETGPVNHLCLLILFGLRCVERKYKLVHDRRRREESVCSVHRQLSEPLHCFVLIAVVTRELWAITAGSAVKGRCNRRFKCLTGEFVCIDYRKVHDLLYLSGHLKKTICLTNLKKTLFVLKAIRFQTNHIWLLF